MSIKMFMNSVRFNGDAPLVNAIKGERGEPGRDGAAVADERTVIEMYKGLSPYIALENGTESISNAAVGVVKNVHMTGRTIQNGTPTPTAPIPLESTQVRVTLRNDEDSSSAESPFRLRSIVVPNGGNVVIDGVQYLSDTFDLESKTITRYVGAFTGAEAAKQDWYSHSKGFYFQPKNCRDMGNSADQRLNLVFSDYYEPKAWTTITQVETGCCGFYGAMLMVRDTRFANVADFKEAIKAYTGDFLVYPLATPVVEELRDSEVSEFKGLTTVEGVNVIDHNALVCTFDYPVDQQTYVDNITHEGIGFKYYTKSAEDSGVELPFTTPEMFGAVGNGVADDTTAIQTAIDSGAEIYGTGDYLITDTIRISGNMRPEIRLTGTVTYTGTGSAFEISNSIRNNITFGNIVANNGIGISMIADLAHKYCQYNTIRFDYIKAKQHGIFIQARDYYWVNANKFYGGNIRSESYVVFLDGDAGEMFSNAEGNLFDGISFEGNPLGFYFKKGDSETLFNVRCSYTENDHFITTEDHCDTLSIIGGHICSEDMFDLSDETSGTIQGVELRSEKQDYSSNIFHQYAIRQGIIYATDISSYKNLSDVRDSTIRLTDLMADCPSSMQLPTTCDELILSRQYGVTGGINEIVLKVNFSADHSSVTVRETDGTLILNVARTGTEEYKMVKLEWFKHYGWAYSYPTFVNVDR